MVYEVDTLKNVRFSCFMLIVMVGSCLVGSSSSNIQAKYADKSIAGSYLLLDNARPLLRMERSDYFGVLRQNFEVCILLAGENSSDLSPEWDVAAVSFNFTFDPTLLSGVSVACDPDGWFASFWPNGISTTKKEINNGSGRASVAFSGVPNENGTHTAVFGQGGVAKITFKAIYEQLPPPFVSPTCSLNISESGVMGFAHPERPTPPWNRTSEQVPIPHLVENGTYHAPVRFLTGVDIYQYYEIGLGKGINEPTDMLWPQKVIKVYALVQYNLWPEQGNNVAFQIIDPYNNIEGMFYNVTDSNGLCCVSIRLPWPCDDPDYYFGKWKIFASASIAGQVYTDTMEFEYNYRVRVFKADLDKTTCKPGDNILVTIEFGTLATNTFDALFEVTATDSTGVPIACNGFCKTVGGASWSEYENGIVELSLRISESACPGYPGTIWVSVLSDWPASGGEAYYPTRHPETAVDFSILNP
jgi:hypothetical protein